MPQWRSYSVDVRLVNGEGDWIYTGGFNAPNIAAARQQAQEMVAEKHRAEFEVRVTREPKRKRTPL